MTAILVHIPEDQAESFVELLTNYPAELAKNVTIRVLSDQHEQEIIHDFNKYTKSTIAEILGSIDFPVEIPDYEYDDDILPLEDLIDNYKPFNPMDSMDY